MNGQTPRTDAAELDNNYFTDWGGGKSGYVMADFARQLERDLTAAQKKLAKYKAKLDRAVRCIEVLMDNGSEVKSLAWAEAKAIAEGK